MSDDDWWFDKLTEEEKIAFAERMKAKQEAMLKGIDAGDARCMSCNAPAKVTRDGRSWFSSCTECDWQAAGQNGIKAGLQ
jgi:hypothetical protein